MIILSWRSKFYVAIPLTQLSYSKFIRIFVNCLEKVHESKWFHASYTSIFRNQRYYWMLSAVIISALQPTKVKVINYSFAAIEKSECALDNVKKNTRTSTHTHTHININGLQLESLSSAKPMNEYNACIHEMNKNRTNQ